MIDDLLGSWSLGWEIGSIVLLAYLIGVALVIVSEDREPTTTLAWILLLWMLPVFGLVLYFFAGRNWRAITPKRQWVADLHRIRVPFMTDFYAPHHEFTDAVTNRCDDTAAERIIGTILVTNGAPPIPGHNVEIVPSGAEYFPILIEDILSAERFVHMQYFIWERDELTKRICDALADRLKAGVEVRVLNDFIGNIKYKKDQLNELKQLGAKIGSDVTDLGKANYRNHRKMTIIDGRRGHSGGVNIGQEYIDGGERYPMWRDTGMRFDGPIVGELQKLFADRWFEVFGESLFDTKYFPDPHAPVPADAIPMQIVAQGVEDPWESARRAHLAALGSAEKRVWIQSPYFVPDQSTFDALIDSALGGIDTRFMMTGWPDKKSAFRAAQSYWKPFVRAGGKMYLYEKGFFHAKSIVVDGICGAVGTMNMDIRSLLLHKELMVWMYDEATASQLEAIFENDLKECRLVTLEEIEAWSDGKRMADSAYRLASNLL